MRKIISFIRSGKFEEYLGCIALLIVIIPVIINIINRQFLNKYSTALEATALFAYVWIGYGFFGYMYKKDSHVDMKFVVNMMSPKVRKFFDVVRDVFICLFSCYMVYWGCKLFRTNTARYVPGTRIPYSIGYASIIFGYFSGAVRSFCTLVSRLVGNFRKKAKEETAYE